MPIDIVGVVSNHETFREIVEFNGYKFHHLPIQDNKQKQEEEFHNIAIQSGTQLIVLARYMQILSQDFVSKWSNNCINIHHSFLPSFKGAKPYHQAFERGVKIIGATAHFVNQNLDEGPIIEQDVEKVDHELSPSDLVTIGKDIEARVLYKAIKNFSQGRVFLNGKKTIVFKGDKIL